MDSQRQIRYGELIRSLISQCLLREDFYTQDLNPTSITVSLGIITTPSISAIT